MQRLFPSALHHHGVTHTLFFVGLVGAAVGLVFGRPLVTKLRAHDRASEVDRPRWAVAAVAIAEGVSHLFMDMLSAPDIADPVEPLWPLYNGPISFDVVYYDAWPWNAGLLAVGVLLHVGLWRRSQRDRL